MNYARINKKWQELCFKVVLNTKISCSLAIGCGGCIGFHYGPYEVTRMTDAFYLNCATGLLNDLWFSILQIPNFYSLNFNKIYSGHLHGLDNLLKGHTMHSIRNPNGPIRLLAPFESLHLRVCQFYTSMN